MRGLESIVSTSITHGSRTIGFEGERSALVFSEGFPQRLSSDLGAVECQQK